MYAKVREHGAPAPGGKACEEARDLSRYQRMTPTSACLPNPFVIRSEASWWMGENHFTAVPTALYGIVLLMAAIAYHLLQQAIMRTQGKGSILKDAIGSDWKGKLSPVLYLFAVVATLRSSWIAQAVLVIAALIWLIPGSAHRKTSCRVWQASDWTPVTQVAPKGGKGL
jgi:hypothetical protein